VVTHDRWFLDAVCTATWEVVDEQVYAYEGGYAAWTLPGSSGSGSPRRSRPAGRTCSARRSPGCAAGPPARTSKPQFRIDAANALIADVPPVRDTVSLQRLAVTRLGKQVYDLENVTLTAGSKPILDG
jgi:ATPase subunit of ABC transporter with duplicated ATPase domains